ncbi:hypothetical protein Prudu_018804 [Prunus dulcis]|uniref:Uncharacterized protein n=1 Tax=Prunus dulcis TaxID=3755 RepID=A0A4Y1RT83_PRUDU|nr:hypothetical protein Prudu_018804 [Prunus dulcis]
MVDPNPWVYTSLAQAGEGAEACVVSIVTGSFECTDFATWQFGFLSRFLRIDINMLLGGTHIISPNDLCDE